MKFGITPEEHEQLEDGETVVYTIPDLVQPGRNTDIEIELVDPDDVDAMDYENGVDLARKGDE